MSSPVVAIVDYQMSNMFSVQRACEFVGLPTVLASDAKTLQSAAGAILPGVGAFGAAMENLEKLDLLSALRDFAASGRPLLGVCLGMQLLFTESHEFGNHRGLGLLKGTVRRFPASSPTCAAIKVPQIGWNSVKRPHGSGQGREDLFAGVPDGAFMYFVHSYYCSPEDAGVTAFETEYEGFTYCSAVASGSIYATQFHPEKSARGGIRIYENFRSLLRPQD